MATSKACALFLLISATSALFLSSAVVDAVCVPRKLPVAQKKLPQSRATYIRTSPSPIAPKKLPQTRPFIVRTSPSPIAHEKLPQTRPFIVRTSPSPIAHEKLPQTGATFIRPTPQPLNPVITTEAVQVPDHAVVDMCHQTDYPDVCIPSISAHLKGTPTTLSMLVAAIEACTEKTKNAAAEVAKLAADPSKPAADKMALSTCKDTYSSALDSLSNAQKAIAGQDIGTLNSELSAVITYATTCDDSFSEMSVKSPLVVGADRILQKLGSNCLAIAAQTQSGP